MDMMADTPAHETGGPPPLLLRTCLALRLGPPPDNRIYDGTLWLLRCAAAAKLGAVSGPSACPSSNRAHECLTPVLTLPGLAVLDT